MDGEQYTTNFEQYRRRFEHPFYERINTTVRKGKTERSGDTSGIEGKVADLEEKTKAELMEVMKKTKSFSAYVLVWFAFQKYREALKEIVK